MDDVRESEQPSVYHESETAAIVAELWPAGPPRLFALIQEDEDEHEQAVRTITAYGIELPNGEATTIGDATVCLGRWNSAGNACQGMYSELVWLSPAG
jgi:hypothetical protein